MWIKFCNFAAQQNKVITLNCCICIYQINSSKQPLLKLLQMWSICYSLIGQGKNVTGKFLISECWRKWLNLLQKVTQFFSGPCPTLHQVSIKLSNFYIILLTDKQINSTEYITSLVEIIKNSNKKHLQLIQWMDNIWTFLHYKSFSWCFHPKRLTISSFNIIRQSVCSTELQL